MKIKTKTTVALKEKDLLRALEQGTFTGRKIKSVEWIYKDTQQGVGRDSEWVTKVTGAILEFKA
jgi:hypothetical protein